MDPYKILGVSKNATQDEIKKAFRSKAAKYHPDRGGDAWAFEQIRLAYEQLSGRRKKIQKTKPETPPAPSGFQFDTKKTARPTRSKQTKKSNVAVHIIGAVLGGITALALAVFILSFSGKSADLQRQVTGLSPSEKLAKEEQDVIRRIADNPLSEFIGMNTKTLHQGNIDVVVSQLPPPTIEIAEKYRFGTDIGGRNLYDVYIRTRLSITNYSDSPVSAVTIGYQLVVPGRTLPLFTNKFSTSFAGGIEPGETVAMEDVGPATSNDLAANPDLLKDAIWEIYIIEILTDNRSEKFTTRQHPVQMTRIEAPKRKSPIEEASNGSAGINVDGKMEIDFLKPEPEVKVQPVDVAKAEAPVNELETMFKRIDDAFQQRTKVIGNETEVQRNIRNEETIKWLDRELPNERFTFLFPVKNVSVNPKDQKFYRVYLNDLTTDIGSLKHPKMPSYVLGEMDRKGAERIDNDWSVQISGRLKRGSGTTRLGLDRHFDDRQKEMIMYQLTTANGGILGVVSVILDDLKVKLIRPEK